MKIISWNCNGAFRTKFHLLDKFAADVLLIQECEDPARSNAAYEGWAKNYLWKGKNKNKGIGIFWKDGHQLDALGWEDFDLQLFLPCRVNESFNLVAVWTKYNNAPTYGYIGQFWKYLQKHKEVLGPQVVVCGDFNSNIFWDRKTRHWNHSDVVRELKELDILSLYHTHLDEPQGAESNPTFFMHRNIDRPYHIDYAFASANLFVQGVDRFNVGVKEEWLKYSDHMPIIFSILGSQDRNSELRALRALR